MPEISVVNCVLLWARPGMEAALTAYEDKVLRLVAEHGGRVLERGTVLPGSQHDGEPPAEVQFLEMPSEASLDAYVNDPRRLAMAAERDAAIARTDLFRIQVADLLCGPRPVRVRGHAEDVYVTGADLDHEQAGFEDPADSGCADQVAELEQFALDSLISPAVVLGGEPLDERGDLGADRRPSCPVPVGPLAGDQAAVPAQDGAGGD
jgi:uncharacterized protein (DUF1330 family)